MRKFGAKKQSCLSSLFSQCWRESQQKLAEGFYIWNNTLTSQPLKGALNRRVRVEMRKFQRHVCVLWSMIHQHSWYINKTVFQDIALKNSRYYCEILWVFRQFYKTDQHITSFVEKINLDKSSNNVDHWQKNRRHLGYLILKVYSHTVGHEREPLRSSGSLCIFMKSTCFYEITGLA